MRRGFSPGCRGSFHPPTPLPYQQSLLLAKTERFYRGLAAVGKQEGGLQRKVDGKLHPLSRLQVALLVRLPGDPQDKPDNVLSDKCRQKIFGYSAGKIFLKKYSAVGISRYSTTFLQLG